MGGGIAGVGCHLLRALPPMLRHAAPREEVVASLVRAFDQDLLEGFGV